MNIIEIIDKKREKGKLSKYEIEYAVNNYINGEIKDYQMSALLMAICINGLDDEEIVNLTNVMMNSGKIFDFSEIEGIKVDKHSTGGVGDKVTLILMPLMASLGVKMIKMSGKGLGFTGGTVDKLESIQGFNLEYTMEEVKHLANEYNICQMKQSDEICLADKKIYELRDLTGTVDSIGLISSSIMSKKLASGGDKILLEVTCGSGAFASNFDKAKKLADIMVNIGNSSGKETVAVITNMDEPLGKTIGNSLEIIETIEFLKGRCEQDLLELILNMGAYILKLSDNGENIENNKKIILEQIYNGKAYEKFKEWVKIQGGNIKQIEDISLLPKTEHIIPLKSEKEGYILKINAKEIANAICKIGGGRYKKEDKIDYGVGLVLNYKVGDYIKKDDVLCYLHISDLNKKDDAIREIYNAYTFSDNPVEKLKMILDIIK